MMVILNHVVFDSIAMNILLLYHAAESPFHKWKSMISKGLLVLQAFTWMVFLYRVDRQAGSST